MHAPGFEFAARSALEGRSLAGSLLSAAVLCVSMAASACSGPSIRGAIEAYETANYAEARALLDELRREDSSNRHLYGLEQSLVLLSQGDANGSVEILRDARDRIDALSGTSFGESAASLFLDDRSRDWEAADYEQVLVRAMLAVAEMMSRGAGLAGDANAYALQVLDRQQQIIRGFSDAQGANPKEEYRLVSFGSYLRAVMNEEQPLNREVARRAFEESRELHPGVAAVDAGLERTTTGRHSLQGNGVVHVFAFVGRAPYRVEAEETASTEALNIAKLLWAIHRENIALPELRAVPIPALVRHRDNPDAVRVWVNGEDHGRTETVTDVEEVASTEFSTMHDYVVARAILRRALKIVLVEASKEELGDYIDHENSQQLANLGASLIGLLWTSSEAADLRCWSLLPAKLQVARLELSAGEHELEIRAVTDGGGLGQPQTVRVDVRDGRNTYVLALAPTSTGGPPPLTSRAPFLVEPVRTDARAARRSGAALSPELALDARPAAARPGSVRGSGGVTRAPDSACPAPAAPSPGRRGPED